uniref:Protein TOC75, chloroplastic n=1 Tax=Aegilops tauschii TaxID=37682 RepID=M8C4H1_AEGTA
MDYMSMPLDAGRRPRTSHEEGAREPIRFYVQSHDREDIAMLVIPPAFRQVMKQWLVTGLNKWMKEDLDTLKIFRPSLDWRIFTGFSWDINSQDCFLWNTFGSKDWAIKIPQDWVSKVLISKEFTHESSSDWDPHGLPANITVPLSKLSGLKRYKLSELKFFDRAAPGGGGATDAGPEDSFFEMVTLQPGGVYTKSQLLKELETLVSCGMFERVDLEGKAKPDGTLGLTVSFTESVWSAAKQFKCINVGLMAQSGQADFDQDMTEREKMDYLRKQERDYQQRVRGAMPCILPESVRGEVLAMMKKQEKVSARMLQKIRDHVQKWYHNEGFVCAQVVNFGNLNTSEVVCEVVEGDITKVEYQFQDKLGNFVEGNTQIPIIDRELPQQLRPGHIFNIGAGKQALKNINSLALFSNIEVNPRPDETKEGGIVVEIKLKELEPKSAEASIQPGGTVSFEHRNIYGLNRSIVGSVTSSNLLNPQDDLSFKLEYVHPYLDGVDDRNKNRTFKTSCFNTRKLSPVFVAGPNMDEAPPVWVDRVGFKANITESFTRQSKFTYGLVVEEITTRDETNSICTHGSRAMPSGGLSMDGPPTTLSGTGVDRMAFLQANITRDNTEFVNGAVIGDRCIFQLDQGLGIGSKSPLFNRHQLTLTKFINLNNQEKGVGKPLPAVLVLHGHYAGCVGDLPSYDAFTLGGPYSVRGYGMGELGASRNVLEVAGEVRIPVKNTYVYGFAEHGTDLGSSKDVKGNPTEFFRRVGHGSSYGVGVKLGLRSSAISSSPDWILLDTATRCGKYRWESLASATAQASTAKAQVKYENLARAVPEVDRWRTKAWSTRLAPLDPSTDQNYVWSHRTDKVIAVGGDSLGWVDLWWGIVVCNLADDEDFTTRFVPLPGPMPGNEHRFATCSARSLRDVVCVGDVLKFVEIHFHGDDEEDKEEDDGVSLEGRRVDYGWKATAWNMIVSSGDWHAGCTVDTDDIPLTDEMHSFLVSKLPEVKAEKLSWSNLIWYGPTLSMDQDILYMIFRRIMYPGHDEERQVAVDMKKNALEIVSFTAEEKHFCDPTYRPIALSKNQPTSNLS